MRLGGVTQLEARARGGASGNAHNTEPNTDSERHCFFSYSYLQYYATPTTIIAAGKQQRATEAP